MMKLSEKIQNGIIKLRQLPDNHKKTIIISIVIILALPMIYFWTKNTINNFGDIGKSINNINLPETDFSQIELSDNATLPNLEAISSIETNTTPSN